MTTIFQLDMSTEEGREQLLELARAFDLVNDSAEGASEGVERAEEAFDDGTESAGGFGDTLDKLGKIGMAGLGFDFIRGEVSDLNAMLKDGAKQLLEVSAAGTEQEETNNKLSASLLAVTGNSATARAEFALLQQIIGAETQATGFSDEEIADALGTFIRRTGEAKVEARDLSTVLGIAKVEQKNVAEAANITAKAFKGDVEALKELTPLNKEQVATLTKIRDPAERGAEAMKILRAQYQGAAIDVGTAGGAIIDAEQAGGDFVQTLGLLTNGAGVLQSFITPLTGVLRDSESALVDNSEAVQHLILDIGDGLVTVLEVSTEAMIFGAKVGIGFGTAMELIGNSVEVTGRAIVVLGAGITTLTTETMGRALEQIDGFVSRSAQLAEAMGADGLAKDLREGSASLQGWGDDLDELGEGSMQMVKDQLDGMRESAQDNRQALEDMAEGFEDVERFGDRVRGVTGEIRNGLAKSRSEVKSIADGFNESAKGAGSVRDEVDAIANTLAATNKETAEELAQRALILELERLKIGALEQGNEEQLAQLEYAQAIAQAELERLKNADDVLATEQQRVANLRSQYEREQALQDIERARFEELKKQEEERQRRLEAFAELQAEAMQRQVDLLREAGATLDSSLSGIDGDFGVLTDELGNVAAAVADVTARYQELQIAGLSANDALAGSIVGLSTVLGNAAASHIEDTRKASKVRGAFAAAEAGVLYATGNIPGGVAATGASVAHFAIAGGGGGGSTRSSGSSSQTVSRGTSSLDADRQARQTARYTAEAIANNSGGARGLVTINFTGNTVLEETPTLARRLTGMVEQGLENQGRSL